MAADPTLIGHVQDVTGATVAVALAKQTATGLTFFGGESYRVGQVGSFVRIPMGYTSLFGVVTQVGAGAAPRSEREHHPWAQWLTVQLIGERGRAGRFERGISQHPTVNDAVHIVTERDLRLVYGPEDPVDYVSVGHLASAEAIPALVNINKLVTRHSCVLGATGSGKSTTVASLVDALTEPARYPSARVLIMDIHGEYAKALGDRATVFRVRPDPRRNEQKLEVPFWALSFDEFVTLAFGSLPETARAAVADVVVDLKRESLATQGREGVDAASLNVETPVPFCVHKLWLNFHHREHRTVVPTPGGAADDLVSALVLDESGDPVQPGDAMTVTPPLYRTVKRTGPPAERVQWGSDNLGMKQQLALLASKLRDPQFAFLFNPGEWRPNEQGAVERDLDDLLAGWVGGPGPVSILDLSGIPSTVLNDLIGALLRILYDALFWARNLPEGGRERPLMLVLEEAHTYLARESTGTAAAAVRRIAKEGRKYGVGMMLVSQRPSEIDPTILSQCGTLFAMRLANDTDRGQVSSAASDNLKGLFEVLSILRTGETIIVGEAVSLPVRALVTLPRKDRRPDSEDPVVVVREHPFGDGYEGEGGWAVARRQEDYSAVARQWRMQDPVVGKGVVEMDWIDTPESSTISGAGYDAESQILIVEFIKSGRYNYFDVPTAIWSEFQAAPSKGKFHAERIKGVYPYARA